MTTFTSDSPNTLDDFMKHLYGVYSAYVRELKSAGVKLEGRIANEAVNSI